MNGLVDRLLNLNPALVYVVVTALVFVEDALFVGFVIPGETAAVLGGVIASQGRVHLWLITLLGAVALGVDGACQEGCPSLLCRESDSANSANATRTRS